MWCWREERHGEAEGSLMLAQRAAYRCKGCSLDARSRALPLRHAMGIEKNRMTETRLSTYSLNSIRALLCRVRSVASKDESPPLKQVTAEELTALLRQRDAAIHSMKGLFSAKVRGGLIPIASRVEGTVYYRRPNALRLRGFTPLGNELFDFVQVDDLYKLRLPLEGKTYAGHQSDMKDVGKLARFSQLSVWAVGGVLGTNSIARDETVKVAEERGRYRLDVYAPATGGASPSRPPIRRLWFDRRLLVVQEESAWVEWGGRGDDSV